MKEYTGNRPCVDITSSMLSPTATCLIPENNLR